MKLLSTAVRYSPVLQVVTCTAHLFVCGNLHQVCGTSYLPTEGELLIIICNFGDKIFAISYDKSEEIYGSMFNVAI